MPDSWTDAELVQFCLDGPFDEISDERIVALRERISMSNTVRDAVSESPESELLLKLLAMTRQQLIPPPRRSPMVALLLVLCVAVGVGAYVAGSRQAQDQAGTEPETSAGDGSSEPGREEIPGEEVAAAEAAQKDTADISASPAETDVTPGENPSTEPVPVEVVTAETTPTEKKPQPDEDVPWANLLSPDVASYRVEDVVWKAPGEGRIDEFPPTEFRKWFSAIPGRPWQVSDETQRNLKYTKFDGQARLKAPWVADAVLRLAIYDAERCSLFFWRGNEGVRLRYYRSRSPHQFAAHRVTRNGPKSTPEIGQLLTHDNGRWQRSFYGPFEIRHENGQLMLVRGDLPFLRVGFDGAPEEVVVDGKLKVRHIAMYRSDPIPQKHLARFELPFGENQLTSDQPAQLEWTLLGEGAKTASVDLDTETGHIELRAGANDTEDAVTVTPVRRIGLSEIVFRVAQADPGTGVLVTSQQGVPIFRIGFEWDSNGSRLAVVAQAPTAQLVERAFDKDAWPVPWTTTDQWLRIVVGAGTMSLWTSDDGRNWGWIGDSTTRNATPPVAGVGLFALKGADRGITLSHLELRDFPTLNSLADSDLSERVKVEAFGPPAFLDIGTWMHHVIQSQPKDVQDFEAWRQTCAVETLRAGSNDKLAAALLNGLLTEYLANPEVISGGKGHDERFLWRLLGEAALTLDVFDGTMGLRFSHVVHEAIRRRVLNGLTMSSSEAELGIAKGDSTDAILHAGSVTADGMAEFLMMQFWSQQATLLTPQNAAQLELLSLVQQRDDQRVRQLVDRLTFWSNNCHPARPWWGPLSASYTTIAWAELMSQRTLDSDEMLARAWPGRWKTDLAPIRHPLAQTVSKEAYNVMAEFQAAISGRAYADACQVISSSGTSDLLGLLPDTQDDRLLVSFSNAVALAMDRYPELRSSMNEKFGAVGQLRVRQAIENGDSDSIEAAAVQFFGTVAAAESEQWLGDQALAAGQFAAARSHYRTALAGYKQNLTVETAEMASLQSRLEMTDAILGLTPDPSSKPAVGEAAPGRPVSFHGVELTPAQFTELTGELRASGGATATAAGIHGAKAASSAWRVGDIVPPPGGYEVVKRSQIEGDVGEHAGRSAPADVNWFARQTAVEVDGAEAFLCNRFQLTRIDLNTGLPTWKQELGGDHGSVNYWPHLAMRPLLTASRVFCRRLTKTGPELICCDRSSGNVLWRFHPKTLLVSDPLLIRDRLQIFSVTTDATGPGLLRLLTVDATRGVVTEDVEVLRLFAESSLPAHLCLATVNDDRIFFSISGSVVCCDAHGQCVWVRRQSWTPPLLDPMRRIRAWQPPLIHGDTVLVSQPGIDGVDCLDRTSGRILWSRMVPGLKRLVGLSGDQLLVERRDGLESLATQDGQSRWQYHTTSLMDAVMAGPPHKEEVKVEPGDPPVGELWKPQTILVTRWKQLPKNIMEARLVWLDSRDGRALSELPLSELNSREVALGPFLTSGERVWVYGTQSRKEARRILYELVKSETRQPTPLIDESWAAWMPEFRESTFYPSGTFAEPHFTRTTVATTLLDGTRSVSPGWLVQAAPQPKDGGFRPEVHGRKNVLALRLNARTLTEPQLKQTSKVPVDAVRLFRKIEVPRSSGARLTFRVGHEPKQSWKLSICHGTCRLHSSIINDETAPGGWQVVNLDLSEYAGKTIYLVVSCSADKYPSQNWVYLQGPGDPVP